jgi:hypothetical protein
MGRPAADAACRTSRRSARPASCAVTRAKTSDAPRLGRCCAPQRAEILAGRNPNQGAHGPRHSRNIERHALPCRTSLSRITSSPDCISCPAHFVPPISRVSGYQQPIPKLAQSRVGSQAYKLLLSITIVPSCSKKYLCQFLFRDDDG